MSEYDRRTVSLDGEAITIYEEWVEADRYDSLSEAVRETAKHVVELEAEIESERARAEDLRRQLSAQNRRSGEVEEVVEYAREEKALRSDRDAREQRRRSVSILTRTWWRLTGEPPLNGSAVETEPEG
jgi:Arc/MetJ-type ribon-helix-helix transcriptional regulator